MLEFIALLSSAMLSTIIPIKSTLLSPHHCIIDTIQKFLKRKDKPLFFMHILNKQKDFDSWNNQKKEIHNFGDNKLYNARDLWWCNLGINIGFEQDGTGKNRERPVLILKGLSKNTCLVVPLTKSLKQHNMRIFVGKVNEKKSSVIISQIRIVDTKRLINKIGKIKESKFEEIRKAVKDLI